MLPDRILTTLGFLSLVGLACSTADTGADGTLSGTGTTGDPSGGSSGGDAGVTDGESNSNTNASTGGTGTLSGDESSSNPGTTSDISSTGHEDDSTSLPDPASTTGPDESSGTTVADTGETEGQSSTTESSTTDDETTDTGVDPDCQAPATQPPCDQGTSDVFKAIGLNCSADKSMAIPIKNPVFASPDANAWRVATHYGTAMDPMDPTKFAWGPKEGERLLVLGTGLFPALQADGGLTEPDGFGVSDPNGNPDELADLPGAMTWEQGSNNGQGGTPFMNCDGAKDCSDTIGPQWNIVANNEAYDMLYMQFDLDVPVGTHGYLFDFAYFSQEWPEYVDDAYNDMFVVWSTSESFTGNVTFIDEQPLTVTALDPYMAVAPSSPLLAGTGFPDPFGEAWGAGTGWFTAKGSAVPGETFTIAIAIFDMGDPVLDTIGLIDAFRWDCKGCIPTEVMSCGIQPQ